MEMARDVRDWCEERPRRQCPWVGLRPVTGAPYETWRQTTFDPNALTGLTPELSRVR